MGAIKVMLFAGIQCTTKKVSSRERKACLHGDAEQLEEALLGRPEELPHVPALCTCQLQRLGQIPAQLLHQPRALSATPHFIECLSSCRSTCLLACTESTLLCRANLPELHGLIILPLLSFCKGASQLHELSVPAFADLKI